MVFASGIPSKKDTNRHRPRHTAPRSGPFLGDHAFLPVLARDYSFRHCVAPQPGGLIIPMRQRHHLPAIKPEAAGAKDLLLIHKGHRVNRLAGKMSQYSTEEQITDRLAVVLGMTDQAVDEDRAQPVRNGTGVTDEEVLRGTHMSREIHRRKVSRQPLPVKSPASPQRFSAASCPNSHGSMFRSARRV